MNENEREHLEDYIADLDSRGYTDVEKKWLEIYITDLKSKGHVVEIDATHVIFYKDPENIMRLSLKGLLTFFTKSKVRTF